MRLRPLWILLPLVGACTERTPPIEDIAPVMTSTTVAQKIAPDDPASHGSMSEAEFAALHTRNSDAAPKLEGKEIEVGGARAYLSMPEGGEGPLPAVLVIHEWWGLTEHIEHWTDRLAQEGYVALAIDLYDGAVAEEAKEALTLMKAVKTDAAMAEIEAGLAYLRGLKAVDGAKVASIGWCFGGGWSLRTGLMDAELAAVVMYYGRPVVEASKLKPLAGKPLLGIFGAQDASIPTEKVEAFEAALKKAGVEAEIVSFEAPHAFANPSGGAYDPEKAEKAWEKTKAMLASALKE